MSRRPEVGSGRRLVWVIMAAVVAIVIMVGYVVHQRSAAEDRARDPTPVAARSDLGRVLAGPHVVFRNAASGADYGKVSVVPMSDPSGPRVLVDKKCDRVYATKTDAVCLLADLKLTPTWGLDRLDAAMNTTGTEALFGTPSRTRISPDGTVIATTTFVGGDSYAVTGSFSTRTIIRGPQGSYDLEDAKATLGGAPLTAADRNFWGVTFVDDDTFYVTAFTKGQSYLMKGTVSGRTLSDLHTHAECPSVSPDRTRVAFKVRDGKRLGSWHLGVLDLATQELTMVAERRSVDDQVEWLDDHTVLYELPNPDPQQGIADIWRVPADGSGSPQVFIPNATSPAVVR